MKALDRLGRWCKGRFISAAHVILSVVVATLSFCAYAQKAPVNLGFDVTSSKRQQLQSFSIAVEVKFKKDIPFVEVTSSAAADGDKPEWVTATSMKKNETARVEEKLLLSDDLPAYLRVTLSGEVMDDFRTPATIDIPIFHSGTSLKFGRAPIGNAKPSIGSANFANDNVVANTNVRVAATEAPRIIEGYEAIARLNVGIQKAGLQLSSKQVAGVEVHIGTDGGVSIAAEKPLLKSIPPSTDPVVEEIPFAIALGERGRIVGQVVAKDAAGNVLYGRKTILYVVSDQRKLYSGSSSFLDLDIQKLNDDLQAGQIKQDEYEKRMTLLLSGKVTESN